MKFTNRLILDEDQEPTVHLAGGKITTAHTAGSFGFSHSEAETDVVELRHVLDTSEEPVFITVAMFKKIKAAFRELGLHRARVSKAETENLT